MIPSIHLAELNNVCECAETGEVWDLNFFIIILLASPKKKTNKETNKQKERWQGHRNSCGQLQRARILKKIKTRNIKKHNDTRKLQLHTTSYWTRQGTNTITFYRGVARIFQRGGHRQGHHPGIADYIWFIPLLSLVYQRAQSYYCGMKAHIN